MSRQDRPAPPRRGGAPGESDRETVQFRSVAEAQGFTLLPNRVLRSPRISAEAKILYALLRDHAGRETYAFPGQERLAAHVPCGRRSAVRYLQELTAAGLITIERRGVRRTNVYWIEPLAERLMG